MPEVEGDRISVTHLNIRPSISILLLQLIFINILAAAIVILGYLAILNYPPTIEFYLKSLSGLVILGVVFAIQIVITIYAALKWINEYYELTPKLLIHKKGIFFRKIEKYAMEHIRFAIINQGILGQLFNYGTITLLDARKEKFLDLYLIHNPTKYLEVFEKLNPEMDEIENVLREEIFNRPEN